MLSPRSKEALESREKLKKKRVPASCKTFPKGHKAKAYCHCSGKKTCSKPKAPHSYSKKIPVIKV